VIDLEFRLDCGATWLNLLATRGRSFSAQPVERIARPDRLREWLRLSDLEPTRPPDQADVARAVELRETLRPLAMAVVEGLAPPADAVAALTAWVSGTPEPVLLTTAGRLRREPPADSTAALRRIALQAVDQLTGAGRESLAVCPEHDCRGVFANPGGRRRWCPAPACASRGRVRALRERRQSGG
jgi:predicted RNA-binding Zn ribbon-like protein